MSVTKRPISRGGGNSDWGGRYRPKIKEGSFDHVGSNSNWGGKYMNGPSNSCVVIGDGDRSSLGRKIFTGTTHSQTTFIRLAANGSLGDICRL